MSSSTGDPSKKMSWFRSMCAKFDNETKIKELAKRSLPRETNVDRRKQKREDQIYKG